MNLKLKSYFHFIFVIKDTTQKTKDRATKASNIVESGVRRHNHRPNEYKVERQKIKVTKRVYFLYNYFTSVYH
jgi:hypothetical protein